MSTAIAARQSFSEIQSMGNTIAESGLFGVKNPKHVVALMLIAQAEGRHPASVAQEYDIIQGRPALKSTALLARFQAAGGTVKWDQQNTTDKVAGTFSHPAGGSMTVTWDMGRAKQAGLAGKDNWKKYPSAMMRARCIAEGVRAVYPGCCIGEYVPEEVQDFEPREVSANVVEEKSFLPEPEVVQPKKKAAPKKKAPKKKAPKKVDLAEALGVEPEILTAYCRHHNHITDEQNYTQIKPELFNAVLGNPTAAKLKIEAYQQILEGANNG